MNLFHFLLRFPLSGAHAELFQQARSGPPWGWILLILLILALVILWWLLGPGAKRRRRRMTDLPKPAKTAAPMAAKPTPPAGLPVAAATAPPAKPMPAVPASKSVVNAAEAGQEEAEARMADEVAGDSSDLDKEIGDAEDSSAGDDTSVEEGNAAADDLRRIDGIGPKVAGILAANGIATFAQLADTSVERLAEILEAEGLKFMKPDTWPEQAAFAAKGDWVGLQGLQGELKGGRRVEE